MQPRVLHGAVDSIVWKAVVSSVPKANCRLVPDVVPVKLTVTEVDEFTADMVPHICVDEVPTLATHIGLPTLEDEKFAVLDVRVLGVVKAPSK